MAKIRRFVKVCMKHNNLCVAYMPSRYAEALQKWLAGDLRPGTRVYFNAKSGVPVLVNDEHGYTRQQLRLQWTR